MLNCRVGVVWVARQFTIRVFLNPQLFLSRYGFRSHVSGESGRRIRNFLNPLFRVKIFEFAMILVWTRNPVGCNKIEPSSLPWKAGQDSNRPFPSSKKSHFQNEGKCKTFIVKMSFICIIIKKHFHVNGFALSLALKVRFFGTRKWPIARALRRMLGCQYS